MKDLEKHKDLALQTLLPPLTALTRQYFKPEGLPFDRKSDKSPVTEADKRCEELFRDLASKHTPSFGIIGEEYGNENAEDEWVWSIDPIDGTRAFSRGLPFWGIQIGLLHKGDPILGVIDYPAWNQTVWGAKGLGSHSVQNQKKLILSQETEFNRSVLIHSGASAFQDPKYFDGFNKLVPQFYLERAYGDCAMYGYLFSGNAEVILDQALHPWDSIPMFVLIEEAGGVYLTLEGKREWREQSPFIGGREPMVKEVLSYFDGSK